MPICETCGNDYDKSFQIMMNGQAHIFDSFECAIKALAPTWWLCIPKTPTPEHSGDEAHQLLRVNASYPLN